jgi:hypothetical protein
VPADKTLSAALNARLSTSRFANGGLNGAHPLALSGLVRDDAASLQGQRVLVHCNLLWMSSAERDLQVDKELSFNHPQLVPQFFPRIPAYKASITDRLGVVVDRRLPFRGWVKHVRVTALGGQDLHRWTLEHPGANPLRQIMQVEQPVEDPLRQAPVSWAERGIQQQDIPWIDLDTSLQWGAFRDMVECLTRRNNDVLVVVGPLNEHMLSAGSRARYRDLVAHAQRWLSDRGIAHVVPSLLPSAEYADSSHPLAEGYARMAEHLAGAEVFRGWLE